MRINLGEGFFQVLAKNSYSISMGFILIARTFSNIFSFINTTHRQLIHILFEEIPTNQ